MTREGFAFGTKLNLSHRTPGKRSRRSTAHVLLRGVEHKSCAKCASLKPLAEFTVDHGTSDELSAYCRTCDNEMKRAEYARRKGAA